MRSRLPERVLRTIHEHNLFGTGDTVVVAFSGGADSCALLEILASHGFRLVAAHLNHCLRGEESDTDEEFCRTRAAVHRIPFEAGRTDVAAFARREGLNLEDAGRRARHIFLETVRQRHRAVAIALAHHADDQAETVLMRLLRGSGITGLSGMAFKNGLLVRPLLGIARSEIERYLDQAGVPHREDASNRDVRFLRNRIRHELLPLLEEYNPSIRSTLATTARLCADDESCLEEFAAVQGERVMRYEDGRIVFDLPRLLQALPALQRRLLRLGLRRLNGDLRHIGSRHILALQHLASSPRPNARITLPGGLYGRRCYEALILERTCSAPIGEEEATLVIPGPGEYRLPWGGSLCVSFQQPPSGPRIGTDGIAADRDEIPFPWLVRTFRNGDRITPSGMTGSKKVKDLFIDAKVPVGRRRRIPLVFSAGRLIWVCGLRSSCCSRDTPSQGLLTAVYRDS